MKEYGDSVNFSKLNRKVNDLKMTFDPTSVEVTCVTLPKDHIPSKYVDTVTLLFKNFLSEVQARWKESSFLFQKLEASPNRISFFFFFFFLIYNLANSEAWVFFL